MNHKLITSAAGLAMVSIAVSASAAFDSTMYSVGADLSSFSNLISSLNITDTLYDFPFDATQFTTSGYVREVNGNPIDTTGLVTNVFQVNQQTMFTQGASSITLNAGDMVWAYTIDLVSASSNTVSSMNEFQVGGFTFLPDGDVMDGSVVLGRGFLTPDAGVSGPLGGNSGDLSDLGDLGASLDWQWSDLVANQLGNDQTITLLMFTSAANIGNGFANLLAPPIQADGVDPAAIGAPVLIPTAIPAPGSSVMFLGLGLFARRRRR